MADYIYGLAAPTLFWIAVGAWFLILVGSVAAAAFIYWLRDWWRNRGR